MLRFLALPAALAVGVMSGAFLLDLSSGLRSAAGSILAHVRPSSTVEPGPDIAQASQSRGEGTEKGHAHDGADPDDHPHGSGQADHDHAGHDHAGQDLAGQDHAGHDHGSAEGVITLTPQQIESAGIRVAPVSAGVLSRRLVVPGVVTPDAERVARVAAKVVGTVAELRKRLGESVRKGDVVAVIDSREVADAKNDYIAALVGLDLQEMLFARDHALWDRKISAEQQFLRARTSLVEAQLKVNLARQKLSALGVPEAEVAALAETPTTKLAAGEDEHMAGLRRAPLDGLQRYNLRAPISGQIIERRVDLGAPVNDEGQEKEIYTIADLSQVWVELAVPVSDLGAIAEGQSVALTRSGSATATPGRIVFVSPMLDPQTRAAKVIAVIANPDLAWRPGSFATVEVAVGAEAARVRVPREAIQTVEGESVVFVRRPDGFAKRVVSLGQGDREAVAIVSGLMPGEVVAIAGSFILKAELGKAEAEHAH
ncbi:efflux RND transporter periplasmic adaptor subunit [Methylobacterium soli]|uniref:Efflux RND transporter periplasmic adaptor subunit n=1 Tax=Methylobacterium soli TaxID=553447 RepID=A0A6L3T5Q4_9HYPH|nr:efflux RND transporter periplasmic adaptor subunit [Methylobacterium soli]KAB1081376.1 efflux RND transporter periplasmic adaptor subunit [Methylobacterium soli]GJE45396.1 Multidrug resistance protein MdtA [Methylobacterium soli]